MRDRVAQVKLFLQTSEDGTSIVPEGTEILLVFVFQKLFFLKPFILMLPPDVYLSALSPVIVGIHEV